ncbi:MAG: OmpA family protein [Bacteroidaceae bacterium]|nr:OmpA family protein [Bacteroidaceae bacterium]
MNYLKRRFVPAFVMLAMILFAASCSNENVSFKKGEQSYAIGEYYVAAGHFKKSYSKTPTKDKEKRAHRAFMMGECYRHIGFTQKAIAAYQSAVRYGTTDSTATLQLARQQLKAGQYKQAAENFQTYLRLVPNDELALNGLKSCKLAPEWKENPNLYSVKREAVFNSRRTDYSPMLVGDDADQIVFSTTRNGVEGDETSGVTGMNFGDLFFSKKNEQGKWQQPEAITGDVNTAYDEGASCLAFDGKTMYFTRCSSDPDYPRYAEIWQSTRSDASWSKPTKCEISKDTLSSFAHPAVSPDGEWLYFVSDMPGGEGGLDIWRTRITATGFGGVENVGRPINTPGDEMFPAFRPNGDLYFSSDGHPGMGGLDIFIAYPQYAEETAEEAFVNELLRSDSKDDKRSSAKKLSKAIGWVIENQQYPLNSSADDYGMTFEGVHNRGYFSSSRGDGKGWEHIYSFECPEILQTVTGYVYEKDGYELPEALVYLVGNDGTNEKLSVKGDGSFTYVLKPGVEYVLLGTCKGYLNVKNEICVPQAEESMDSVLQFPLPPINVPVLIDNIFYEFDKADLTPESTDALDKLVEMMDNNPNITIELAAHCDYRGNDDYNRRLSQRRAESVVRYMTEHGVKSDRLTAVGYGESRPKIITKKLTETYKFVAENDTLTESFILKKSKDEQEQLNALNRRTEFKVLRTTYGTTLKEYNKDAIDVKHTEHDPSERFLKRKEGDS